MLRNLVAATIVAVGLAFGNLVQANAPGGHSHSHGGQNHGHSGNHAHHGHQHAHHFSRGHIFRGRGHHHWARSYYSARYRTTFYYDAILGDWYYWSARREAFYPMSYLETEPPTTDLGNLVPDGQ